MRNEEKIEQVLNLTGLNWEVEKDQLCRPSGIPTDTFGLFRGDNGTQLNTGVKQGYQVYQNAELVHDMIDVVGDYLQLDNMNSIKGGLLQEGRKVFVSFPLEQIGIGQNNDTLKRYITFLNSHDGSASVCLGSSNQVVSCSNTFFTVAKELKKVRHTQSMTDNINFLKTNLSNTIEQERTLVEAMQSLVGVPFDTDHFVDIVDLTYNNEKLDYNELSTRRQNQIQSLTTSIKDETAQKGSDLWGLFNGVTYETNHNQGKDGLKNVMIGQGAKANKKALDYVLSVNK
jgi:hypothetical protein